MSVEIPDEKVRELEEKLAEIGVNAEEVEIEVEGNTVRIGSPGRPTGGRTGEEVLEEMDNWEAPHELPPEKRSNETDDEPGLKDMGMADGLLENLEEHAKRGEDSDDE